MACPITNVNKNHVCGKSAAGIKNVYYRTFQGSTDIATLSTYAKIELGKWPALFTAEVQGEVTSGFAFLRTLTISIKSQDAEFVEAAGKDGAGLQFIIEYVENPLKPFLSTGPNDPLYLTGGSLTTGQAFGDDKFTELIFTGFSQKGSVDVTPV